MRVVDLRAADTPSAEPSAAGSPAGRLRDPVALPPNMTIEAGSPSDGSDRSGASSASVTITRRWLRAKHYVLLLVLLAMSGGVAFGWKEYGFSVWLLLASLLVTSWAHMLLSMFLNRTVIRVGDGRIDVSHGPIPNLVYRGKSVSASDLRQLYAGRFGAGYAVKAQLADGSVVDLVTSLVTAEQAIFVEQQLERVLGLVDFDVAGELGSSYPAAVAGPGAGAGKGGAALIGLVPLVIGGGIVAAFFLSTSTSLEGSLRANGELGAWVITPDDCSSGQRAGFMGVELSSSADPSTRIRLTEDPVRGSLAVVETSGQRRPTVIDVDGCRQLELTITRTSTSVNDVWLIDGSATLDCDLLSGHVTFEGCN